MFHRHFADPKVLELEGRCSSHIEGIGRARVEPSFLPEVIDRMIAVPDASSIGAMRAVSNRLGRQVGGSTGTNIAACVELMLEMQDCGEQGSIVTLLCDSGRRYADTYFNDAWLVERGLDWRPHADRVAALLDGGERAMR